MNVSAEAVVSCLLGAAVGDALGLPFERLSRKRRRKMFGPVEGHRLFFGRGLISDDAEHLTMTASSLLQSGGEAELFEKILASQFKAWLMWLPSGAGQATLKAGFKLWMGVSPQRSGVFSAGNGPAMRAPILGVCCDDLEHLQTLTRISTRLTHTDPKAEHGAFAVALAAHLASRSVVEGAAFLKLSRRFIDDEELLQLIERAAASAQEQQETVQFAADLGLERGVSGYIYHTVPIAIQAWLRFPFDYRRAVAGTIECGGDADSTAAIVGALVGARVGKTGIPEEWLKGICDWPRSTRWMEELGQKLATALEQGETGAPPALFWPALPVRNALFLIVVLTHAARRLLPPY